MSATPMPYNVVYDTDNGLRYEFPTGYQAVAAISSGDVTFTGSITQASTFPASAGAHSYQGIAGDTSLEAGSGSSAAPKFLAGGMFSLHGASLTKTANYLGGVIGQYDIPGTKSTTYPAGAVLGMIADGTTSADGAFVAFTDGDSAQTNARAAFTVMNNNSTAGSGFTVGLDLKGAAHNGYQPVSFSVAEIRLSNGIKITSPSATTVVFTSADNSKTATITLS